MLEIIENDCPKLVIRMDTVWQKITYQWTINQKPSLDHFPSIVAVFELKLFYNFMSYKRLFTRISQTVDMTPHFVTTCQFFWNGILSACESHKCLGKLLCHALLWVLYPLDQITFADVRLCTSLCQNEEILINVPVTQGTTIFSIIAMPSLLVLVNRLMPFILEYHRCSQKNFDYSLLSVNPRSVRWSYWLLGS